MKDLTPRSLLTLWPSLEVLAEDTGATLSAVRKWPQRDSIPPEYWDSIVVSAKARGIRGVSLAGLAAMRARRAFQEAS